MREWDREGVREAVGVGEGGSDWEWEGVSEWEREGVREWEREGVGEGGSGRGRE